MRTDNELWYPVMPFSPAMPERLLVQRMFRMAVAVSSHQRWLPPLAACISVSSLSFCARARLCIRVFCVHLFSVCMHVRASVHIRILRVRFFCVRVYVCVCASIFFFLSLSDCMCARASVCILLLCVRVCVCARERLCSHSRPPVCIFSVRVCASCVLVGDFLRLPLYACYSRDFYVYLLSFSVCLYAYVCLFLCVLPVFVLFVWLLCVPSPSLCGSLSFSAVTQVPSNRRPPNGIAYYNLQSLH